MQGAWREKRHFLDGDKNCLSPGAAGPLSFTLPIQMTRTTSKGSEKPSWREHLPGQLSNFWGGEVGVLSAS